MQTRISYPTWRWKENYQGTLDVSIHWSECIRIGDWAHQRLIQKRIVGRQQAINYWLDLTIQNSTFTCHSRIMNYRQPLIQVTSDSVVGRDRAADYPTQGHRANIFTAKFMPHTSDNIIVSGAGDSEIRIFDLTNPEKQLDSMYVCHSDQLKKICVYEDNPYEFLSCSQDGKCGFYHVIQWLRPLIIRHCQTFW